MKMPPPGGLINEPLLYKQMYKATPLYMACEQRNKPMIHQLLKEPGIDVNKGCNMTSLTPLHHTTEAGYTNIVTCLLRLGAKIGSDVNGYTPIHYAAMAGYPDILQYLLQSDSSHIDDQTKGIPGGYTALHEAVLAGKIQCVKVLLQWNANVHIKTKNGKTAIYFAKANNCNDIVNLLYEYRSLDENFCELPEDMRHKIIEQTDCCQANGVNDTQGLSPIIHLNDKDINAKSMHQLQMEQIKSACFEGQQQLQREICQIKCACYEDKQKLQDQINTLSNLLVTRLDCMEHKVEERERMVLQNKDHVSLPGLTLYDDGDNFVRRNLVYLTNNIVAMDHVDYLYQEYVISLDELQMIHSKATDKGKNRELLYILAGKKIHYLETVFKKSLEQHNVHIEQQ